MRSRSGFRVFLNDWLIDQLARRPGHIVGRVWFRDPEKHRVAFEAVLQALALTPSDHLLDLGCGGGGLLRRALESGCTAAGVDHSRAMVRLARRYNAHAVATDRLRLVRASAENLPFADHAFMCVAMTNVFHFFAEPVAVLGECRRVLCDDGRLAVYATPPELKGTAAALWPVADRAFYYDDRKLAELARAAGLRGVAISRTSDNGQLLLATRRDAAQQSPCARSR